MIKSPGSDGFTAEFFKCFWMDIGNFIVIGIITCIPKSNKRKQYLNNWRPLTLLNCVYKMASACIANRIKQFLDKLSIRIKLVFIKGTYIGENIRLIYDIMHYTEYITFLDYYY